MKRHQASDFFSMLYINFAFALLEHLTYRNQVSYQKSFGEKYKPNLYIELLSTFHIHVYKIDILKYSLYGIILQTELANNEKSLDKIFVIDSKAVLTIDTQFK